MLCFMMYRCLTRVGAVKLVRALVGGHWERGEGVFFFSSNSVTC